MSSLRGGRYDRQSNLTPRKNYTMRFTQCTSPHRWGSIGYVTLTSYTATHAGDSYESLES